MKGKRDFSDKAIIEICVVILFIEIAIILIFYGINTHRTVVTIILKLIKQVNFVCLK